jgi:cysteine sulfinate desulfinase/cysteine desulfurase-like protein
MRTIYLDNNPHSKVAPKWVEAKLPYFTELYGIVLHAHFRRPVEAELKKARRQLADLLGADHG